MQITRTLLSCWVDFIPARLTWMVISDANFAERVHPQCENMRLGIMLGFAECTQIHGGFLWIQIQLYLLGSQRGQAHMASSLSYVKRFYVRVCSNACSLPWGQVTALLWLWPHHCPESHHLPPLKPHGGGGCSGRAWLSRTAPTALTSVSETA